jgi:hypothetical protein
VASTLVQSVTGTGALVLNSVAAGNLLVVWQSIFRATTTQAAVATPTDSNGTFVGGIAGVPALYDGSASDIGVGIFYEVNAASGTHTVTPEAASADHQTLAEFSEVVTSSALDTSATAKTIDSDITSQVTGTTASVGQADMIIVIGLSMGANVGVGDTGFTNPVSDFTTLQIVSNTASDVATFHSYKIVTNASGTQSATFNWTQHEAVMSAHAAIAAFKGGLDISVQIPVATLLPLLVFA